VAHEVTNVGHDRTQLANMARQAQAATGIDDLRALADRGYFSGEEILACEQAGVIPYVPKPLTSGAKADGRFGKQDFVYLAEENAYLCPAGHKLPWHMTNVENGLTLHRYWDLASCRACDLKARCTTSLNRRITRWEHEAVLDTMQRRLDREPDAMRIRRPTVEHVFGTIKAWMGSTHFLTRRIGNVATETSLHVLAYNLKRVIAILHRSTPCSDQGVRPSARLEASSSSTATRASSDRLGGQPTLRSDRPQVCFADHPRHSGFSRAVLLADVRSAMREHPQRTWVVVRAIDSTFTRPRLRKLIEAAGARGKEMRLRTALRWQRLWGCGPARCGHVFNLLGPPHGRWPLCVPEADQR
jgi:hypothetical protein